MAMADGYAHATRRPALVKEMLLLEPWLTNVEPTMVPRPWVKWAVLTRAQDVSAAFMHAIATAIQPPAGSGR